MFFVDILVYSPDYETHLEHLAITLQLLRQHELYAKMSKCIFATQQVQYLGHIITAEGVSTDPTKVDCMVKWPKPLNLKSLRGFLGLTGYYRKFIRHYGLISKPLTDMLKKDKFQLSVLAEKAFDDLK